MPRQHASSGTLPVFKIPQRGCAEATYRHYVKRKRPAGVAGILARRSRSGAEDGSVMSGDWRLTANGRRIRGPTVWMREGAGQNSSLPPEGGVPKPSGTPPLAAMPFGNSSGPLSRRDTTTIAQRFNAGTGQFCAAPVPKGRLNPSSAGRAPFRPALGRPFGTWGHLTAKPSVETLGYSRMSLRDKGRRPGQGHFREALPLGGRVYLPGRTCGLEIRDTADWKSALRLPAGDTRETSGLVGY